MAKCSFCKENIERGTGMILFKNDGSSLNFCSSKCEKNMMKLKRNPRHVHWTKFYEKGEGK